MKGLDEYTRQRISVSAEGCWNWTGSRDRHGYGMFWVDKHHKIAHRAVYENSVGPIPKNLELDHLCRNIACVNPDHLEPVTRKENIRRRFALMTHCVRGHKFTPENTYLRAGTGHRQCRACNKAAAARYKARRQRSQGGA
ncbi:HNH endonuclease signature motif containing protein [Nocardia beijingensis]